MKKKTNGKAKGARAELEVAKLLEAWWAPFEPGKSFKRTPGSGGWAHGHAAQKEFGTAGDIITKAEHFPWSIEIKRREDWSFDVFKAGKPSPVWGWWEQACRDAAKTGKRPMLWFRQSRGDWWVLVSGLVTGEWIPTRNVTLVKAEQILRTQPKAAIEIW
jgi:hypothetical protein